MSVAVARTELCRTFPLHVAQASTLLDIWGAVVGTHRCCIVVYCIVM